jgi:DNA-binding Lrp family transcriptional regulator
MPMAYILLTTETDAVKSVMESLKKIDAVKETYRIYGIYDIIATIKAENLDKLKDIITWDLRNVDNIKSTLTMIVVEETQPPT